MKEKDLKNSILQMAIEGKLVPQDPNDEPASVLLERIREEKHRLIAEGRAKFPKGGESIIYIGSDGSPYEKKVDAKGRVTSDKCIANEVPFEELPEGWYWTRLESVAQILNGDRGKNYPAKSKLHDSGIPFVSAINVERGVVSETSMLYMTEDQYDLLNAGKLEHGDMVFCIRGSLGKFGIFPFERGAIASSLVIVRLIDSIGISVKYLSALFDSALTTASIKRFNNGTAQPNLSAANFQSFLYPIPPLAEQRRIVERVDELMPLVEEYGELEDARGALDAALPGRLRKSVLQLAVQGGLVPQDPADEPAGVLLERIRGQRRQLVAEGKMRAPKGGESIIFAGSDGRRYEKRVDAKGRESDPVCIDDEIPFEIPEGWEWARLSSIASFGGGKTPPTNDKSNFTKDGVLWVTSKDMKQDHISGTIITLSDKGASGLTIYPKCSLIMVTRSGILRRLLPVAILDKPATVNQDQKVIVPDNDSFSEWLLRYFQASDLRIRSKYGKDGTTVESVIFDKVKEILVPIPSLAEQRRVIAHLEELMVLTTN